MTYTAKVTLKFDSTWESTRGIYDEEMIPEQHLTMEVPAEDLNSIQLFRVWESFMQAMGHNEVGIMKGACYVAFNEMRSEESMRKIAEEYDLVLSEDYAKEINKLNSEIYDLKAKLSRLENPENPNYTDEEMDAMTFQEWGDMLIPGSYAAVEKGCKCPVMDNDEMPDDRKWVNGNCPLHGKIK
jgi:hypothetical protein